MIKIVSSLRSPAASHGPEIRRRRRSPAFAAIAASLALSACFYPESPQIEQTMAAPTARFAYADAADLALGAPIIVDLTGHRAIAVDPARAAGVPAGQTRYYVEANVNALLRGQGGLPASVSFLVDRPTADPKLKNYRFLAFARPVPGRPEMIQLLNADALVPWSPDNDALTRTVTQQVVAPDAPPAIDRVIQAFHFPGTVEGEGESQIFLETAEGDPVSLRIVSAPGQPRRWGISLGEVVASRLEPPSQDTLLWYRLACDGLPASLPESGLASNDAAHNAKLISDYRFVLDSLGPCRRNLR